MTLVNRLYAMAFTKTLSQVLVLHTKKKTENTHPIYAILEILQEFFFYLLGSDELLTLPSKRELTEV